MRFGLNKILHFLRKNDVVETKSAFYTKDFLCNKKFQIGEYTYGNPIVFFEDEANLTIGKFCSIAFDSVQIYLGGNHHTEWITTYPFNKIPDFPEINNVTDYPTTKGDVVIGNDVWIGRNVIILSGVHIGDGAVIGAGAVVANDIPPYSIVVGNPARVIKKRFSDEIIDKLIKLAWWNWPIEKIQTEIPKLMSDPKMYFKGEGA